MKATRSSSMSGSAGSSRRRASSSAGTNTSEGDPNTTISTTNKPSLRRSTREREPTNTPGRASPSIVGSPKTQRTRRRATRGLPVSATRGGGDGGGGGGCDIADHQSSVGASDLLITPARQGRGERESRARSSTGRASASKSARKQQQKELQAAAVASKATSAAAAAGGDYLTAIQKNGKVIRVKLIVNGQQFTSQNQTTATTASSRSNHHKKSNNSNNNNSPVLASSSLQSATTKGGSAPKKLSPTILGHDGNLFYCVVCKGFGDVVCCDLCPHVYHPQCVPPGSESRRSLDNDDDPWYCPECTNKKPPVKQESSTATRTTTGGRSEGSSRRTIKHRCQECQQTRSDLSLRPCEICATYIHHPPCRGSTAPTENTSVVCSSCRAEAALTQEEQELHAKKKKRLDEEERERKEAEMAAAAAAAADAGGSKDPVVEKEETRGGRRRTRSMDGDDPMEQNGEDENNILIPDEDRPDVTPSTGQNRKNREMDSPDGLTKSERKRKKKKKKRKRDSDAHLPSEEASTSAGGTAAEATTSASSPHPAKSQPPPPPPPSHDDDSAAAAAPAAPGGEDTPLAMRGPPTQATPAFHFYLAEQRPKIEKLLSRKHRYFNRLPKGGERNALIAKEAAMQWVKLSSVDQKKYINMSMHDYESRIIAWKEEKNIRDMLVEPEGEAEPTEEVPAEDKEADDQILTYEMHERLYCGTSVGSKPYKPEPDQSHNRVLLDLLRDMRFHPLPMFSISRPDNEVSPSVDTSRVSIQHFDVHGPIATSVGDECLGCTRGWPHFCPILQRRIPAIEHRSKLQPAASALISTRVGLGLRPRLERTETEDEEDNNNNNPGNSDLLVWRDAPDSSELRNVRFVPSMSLSDPSSRADDIVEFIEEVLAMKIPVPPRPPAPVASQAKQTETTTPKKSSLARGILPTRQKRPISDVGSVEPAETSSYENVNKCGRCRTIIMNESGCVQCRRAQLVINTSKKVPAASDEGSNQKPEKKELLKVQTAMLGRVITKEAIGESQADADKKINLAILRERWTPCAVMRPAKMLAPSPSRRQLVKSEGSLDDQNANGNFLKGDTTTEQEAMTGSGGQPGASASGDQNTELRPRNRRSAAAPAAFENNDADRLIVARQHREEADKISKRTLYIACHGILLALMRRDPLLLFAQPVTAEGYSAVVKKPIDFSKIRSNVLQNRYHSLGAFVADVRLLCDNARSFNPPGSIYSRTAKDILDVLVVMQRRANKWMSAIKNSHSSFWRKSPKKRKTEAGAETAAPHGDPFEQLRQTWPEAVEMYENNEWMKTLLTADFSRTRENEAAFYGGLAVRRAAKAAEMSLAPYTDTSGMYAAVVKRSESDDEELRQMVDAKVAEIVNPIQLREIASGREETIVRLMRRVQSRRLERRIGSEQGGCARCDGTQALDQEMKAVMNADARWGRSRKKADGESESRVAASRIDLTTGLASAKTRARISRLRQQSREEALESVNDVCVSLRGSRIHGWGLFAEQHFKKGDVVAEYVGECVGLPVADAREKLYQDMRIKDYQFRLDDSQIIDATMKGGLGRYINHNCNPNCVTKILPGKSPNEHLRRVIILAQRDIAPREELTYDYQFPLELNLDARIPCNCSSDICRGFMNWDLPEKGANTGAIRTQKRGANMRDRIRRLGRPLKK